MDWQIEIDRMKGMWIDRHYRRTADRQPRKKIGRNRHKDGDNKNIERDIQKLQDDNLIYNRGKAFRHNR